VQDAIHVVVCRGDETGQELLDVALGVLEADVLGLPVKLTTFDLSLESRRATANRVVLEAAEAMNETGLGLKAATITPPVPGDVGSPNRVLREAVKGTVIVRTGRRIPGVAPFAPVAHPISVIRMAVGDAYGAQEARQGTPGSPDESATRTERITRGVCHGVSEYAFRTAIELEGCVYGGPKWTVSPIYEGLLKEEMDAAARRHPQVPYFPVLIDASYAGLIAGARDMAMVIPALNRDGDCLSDLVLAMFGSIAGAESVLLALDEDFEPRVAMAEAPHGTAPSLRGRDVANPMAMFLAVAAVLDYAARQGRPEVASAAATVRHAVLGTAADGVRTVDLGGDATTSRVAAEIIARVRAERRRAAR
jgi:isocitrate/isopropylmalate dehydrogenase